MPRTRSMPGVRAKWRTGVTVAPLVMVAVLALAACGGGAQQSNSSASTGTADGAQAGSLDLAGFKAALEKVQAAPKYEGPTEGPKPQAGKKVAVVECAAVNTGCAAGAANVKEAADAIGWTSSILDGKGTPTGASQAMVAAINDGADAIVLVAISSPSIIQGMTAAKNANVPVISVVGDNPVGTGPGEVYAEISGQTVESGRAIADYFVVASEGKAKVAAFHVASLASTVNRYKGFIDEMKRCSGCEVVSDQTYGLVSQSEFANMVKAMINAHPDVQYIFVDISQYATIAATALQQSGQEKKIGVAGVDCLPAEVQSIKDGAGEVACANAVISLGGYPAINEAIRALAGEKALQEAYPLRLIDKAIIDKEESPYLGGFTPASGYLKLWGK
jgi:ribose transport system substrate-binding protein